MMIPIVGSLYTSLKINEMSMKWQQKKQNPWALSTEDEDPHVARLKEDAQRVRESNYVSSLNGKLKAGGELTEQELAYLKAKHPEMYQEAVEIKRERQAYKKQLENCKTKDDVDKLKQQKLQEFVSQAKVISSNPNIPEGAKKAQMEKILKRLMGIQNEHIRFTQTQRYQSLPTEKEIREEEEKKEEQIQEAQEALAPDEDNRASMSEETAAESKGSEAAQGDEASVQKEFEGIWNELSKELSVVFEGEAPKGKADLVFSGKPISIPAPTPYRPAAGSGLDEIKSGRGFKKKA